MRAFSRRVRFLVGIAAVAGPVAVVTTPARAAFVAFDNFDSYAAGGSLGGQGPAGNTWTVSPTPGASTTVTDTGGGDNAAGAFTNSIPNYRLLTGPLTIPNDNASSTVYWNFTQALATAGNNWNFVVTDVAAPPDTAGSSEVQFNFDGTQAPAGGTTTWRARHAGAFVYLSTDGMATGRLVPQAGVQYNVWFVINNVADTYQIYMQSNADPALATPVQMRSDAGVSDFGFRNGAAANSLTTINFGNGSTAAGNGILIDDIYVDVAGQNLTNPVPEPTTFGLIGLGALGLLARRRRA